MHREKQRGNMMLVNVLDSLLLLVLLILLILNLRHKNPYPYKSLGAWFATVLVIETLLHGKLDMIFIMGVLLAYWLGTYALIKQERRRLLGGTLINIGLLLTMIFVGMLAIQATSLLMMAIFLGLALLVLFIFSFGGYIAIGFLFWNASIVWRKENRSLGNTLTLLLGVALILFNLFNLIVENVLWTPLLYLNLLVTLTFGYLLFVTWSIITSTLVINLIKPAYDKDYLIVLGAGLIDGERVTPLLAGRIDAAIAFMHAQQAATGHSAKLLMSGGQGSDEKVPESIAMKEYALSVGIPESSILTEERSTTTWENFLFSRDMMQARSSDFKSAYFSNEYHILRAGIFARRLGLKSEGGGSRTSLYFVPNAFIREVAALLLMYKKLHLVAIIGIILFTLGVAGINYFFVGDV
jgi:uncharacterized SAM-binding protein YcdF (DUF218 family)